MSRKNQSIKKAIRLFDFDHTVYNGDASLDFYLYSLSRHPLLLRYLPLQLWHGLLYLASINTRTEFKQGFFIFLNGIGDIDIEIEKFWNRHHTKIKRWYAMQPHNEDVIVSASPEFILEPIAKKMGVRKVIGTRMDENTGFISGENCRGFEKVRRLKEQFPISAVSECYSDSLADLPMLSLAKEKYIVKGNEVIPYHNYTPSRIKQRFFRKSFLTFIFVGVLNAVIGLSFAFLMSMLLHNKTVAFMIGYCLGLIPSYFLNSTMTFHNRDYNVEAFIKYCISYIPNFFVQTVCVAILIEVLLLNTALSYVIAVAVGVPITFLIVSIFAIKDKEIE